VRLALGACIKRERRACNQGGQNGRREGGGERGALKKVGRSRRGPQTNLKGVLRGNRPGGGFLDGHEPSHGPEKKDGPGNGRTNWPGIATPGKETREPLTRDRGRADWIWGKRGEGETMGKKRIREDKKKKDRKGREEEKFPGLGSISFNSWQEAFSRLRQTLAWGRAKNRGRWTLVERGSSTARGREASGTSKKGDPV